MTKFYIVVFCSSLSWLCPLLCKAKCSFKGQGNMSTEHLWTSSMARGGTQGSGSECQLSHLSDIISLSQDETCSKHLIPFGR